MRIVDSGQRGRWEALKKRSRIPASAASEFRDCTRGLSFEMRHAPCRDCRMFPVHAAEHHLAEQSLRLSGIAEIRLCQPHEAASRRWAELSSSPHPKCYINLTYWLSGQRPLSPDGLQKQARRRAFSGNVPASGCT